MLIIDIILLSLFLGSNIMKKFTRTKENFICENCGATVGGNGYTNHCPKCLFSKHVDINPGDRANTCKGLLKPIGIEKFKDTYKIVYKCMKCGEMHRNITASDDDFNLIIDLSVQKKDF